MTNWTVTIKLYFVRTNDGYTTKEEPNPTKKQLDTYMKKGSKYKTYLADIYSYGEYGKMPTKIKYSDGGILRYELDGKAKDFMGNLVFPTTESIKEDIMSNSFEDGMYEAPPPSHGVYPTKKKYEYSFNGKTKSNYEELGVIDCRNRATIKVNKVTTKKKSPKASIK
jgi:hypothetical protein